MVLRSCSKGNTKARIFVVFVGGVVVVVAVVVVVVVDDAVVHFHPYVLGTGMVPILRRS